MSSKSTVKLTGDWRLYEEGFDKWGIYLDFPKEALEGTESGLRLVIPVDVWEVLRRAGHSSAPLYRISPQRLRKLAEEWVDRRLASYAKAEDESEKASHYLDGCLVASLEHPRDKQVEDIVRAYTPPHGPRTEDHSPKGLEQDPDFVYSVYPDLKFKDEGIADMDRGSFCYFCGTQLVSVASDDDGGCYECSECPPVTHWRWNEDTEFLQLYVPGERCPYCGKQIPEFQAATRSRLVADDLRLQQSKKGGKPVTVNGVWWASVVDWCRANNGHDIRKHHNCSKELARMQTRREAEVVWHDRDHIPGTRELIASGR